MSYIPTIHTFEDDVNENRGFDEAPISGGVDKFGAGNILVTEKKESSLTKKILIFIAIIFILASLAVVGYYFYSKWKTSQNEARLNAEALARQNMTQDNSAENDLAKIFPLLAPGISPYVEAAVQKDNVVILTIKAADSIDNYSALYAYILAHKRDLNNDLFYAFKIQDIVNSLEAIDELEKEKSPESLNSSSTSEFEEKSSEQASSPDENTFDKLGDAVVTKIKDFASFIAKPTPVSSNDLFWEAKTLNNQDFEAASAGVLTLVYGYSGQKYAIFATSLKDLFDTINDLN